MAVGTMKNCGIFTGTSPYPGNVPSIPDYTKYCVGV
jgi:hypothetical protein